MFTTRVGLREGNSRVHTPALDHDITGARHRLLHLRIRSLAVDEVKGRRRGHDRELAVEDDHVVGRGRPVLEGRSHAR